MEFLSCKELSEFHLSVSEAAPVRAIRVFFLGCAESETWNSWLRSPRLPPLSALSIVADGKPVPSRERRFPSDDATLCELEIDPRPLTALTLRFPSGPWALLRVETASSLYEGPGFFEVDFDRRFPESRSALAQSGDALRDALLALCGDRDPTLDDVKKLALPFRGGALLGIPEGPVAYQLWHGGIVLRPRGAPFAELGDRVLLRLNLDGKKLHGLSQRLQKGYLPIGEVAFFCDALHIAEEARIDDEGGLRIKLRVKNSGAQSEMLTLEAVAARRVAAKNDSKAFAEVHAPLALKLADTELSLSASAQKSPLTWSISPGETLEAELRMPLDSPSHTRAADCDAFLAAGAKLELPDPHLQNLWRALLLHTRLYVRDGIMRYGLFPGVYENGLFGIEEGWNVVSLAQFGHAAAAQAALTRTFFDAEFLKKEGPHHQYRNGLAITYALDVYGLVGDKSLLSRLWPTIADCARFITAAFASTRVLENGARPPHFGLLPKHIYGGDLRTPAYSLYASSACWRGLRDAGRVAKIVGDEAQAAAFFEAALTVRKDILLAAERIYRTDANPPFLPFRTDETANSPSSGDYYQLFASLILETAVFGWHGGFASILAKYLEDSGRMVLAIPRFDVWFGRLGVDAEYARGSQLRALYCRDFDRFYLGFLGQLALSCDPQTFVSPETAIVRFTEDEERDRLRVLANEATRADSDPCSAGTAVMLQYLRNLLVCEERDEHDLPTGTLWLASAAPAAWFETGKSFSVEKMPTLYGPISFRCTAEADVIRYEIESAAPILVEPFYRDSRGKRRSIRVRAEGATKLMIPRS